MEDLIKNFMQIEPIISGDGSGYGDGDGSGSGSGYGYGDGNGYGSGYGDGSGSGDGDGSGDGYGYGNGNGSGDGYGYGLNSIICEKSEEKEYRKGYLDKEIHSLKTFKGKPVYYIDNTPCIFLAIKDNIAKVEIIKNDFTTKVNYIAKQGNLFAHGDSKNEALQDVLAKHFASLSFSEKKAEFLSKFKKSELYENSIFFDWHHILTGSCMSGRLNFIQEKEIKLDDKISVIEFLKITQNEYNGSIIRDILAEIT